MVLRVPSSSSEVDVKLGKVLESVIKVRGKMTNEEASEFVKEMRSSGRINADVFEINQYTGRMSKFGNSRNLHSLEINLETLEEMCEENYLERNLLFDENGHLVAASLQVLVGWYGVTSILGIVVLIWILGSSKMETKTNNSLSC